MSKNKDFFQDCFNIVASLDVKNESQAIAKEVVLSEVENLQQENKQLKEQLDCDLQWAFKYDKQVDNWNKLKEYIKEEGFEVNTREYGSLDAISKDVMIEKMQELQGSDSNE